MKQGQREALVQEILSLEPALLRARFSVEPPPWLDIDVTMLQLKTLLTLFAAPGPDAVHGLRVSDLARRLGVTPATASTLIDRLVERGLVERREDPQDRRQHRCLVSIAGQGLLARFCEASRSQSAALLEVLSEDELEAVLRGITVMIGAAERVAGGRPPLPAEDASSLAGGAVTAAPGGRE